jgi:hypothetical protein
MSKDAVPSGRLASGKSANSSLECVSQAELAVARQRYKDTSERLFELCQAIQKGFRHDPQALSRAVAEFNEARTLRDCLEQLLAAAAKQE